MQQVDIEVQLRDEDSLLANWIIEELLNAIQLNKTETLILLAKHLQFFTFRDNQLDLTFSDNVNAIDIMTNITKHLNQPGVVDIVASYLPLEERQKLVTKAPGFFSPGLVITELLSLAMMGEENKVVSILRRNPELVFKKGQVTAPCGRVMHEVSVLQLSIFNGNEDMFNKIKPFLAKNPGQTREQCLVMLDGGADLVKMNQDPNKLAIIDIKQDEKHLQFNLRVHEFMQELNQPDFGNLRS